MCAAEISKVTWDWMSEATQQGAYFLRDELSRQRPDVLKDAIEKFQNAGGFNTFYAFVDPDQIRSASLKIFSAPLTEIDLSEPINSSGDSLLHIFSTTNQEKALSRLLDVAVIDDINLINKRGETPLYRASMAGLTQHIIMLLRCGADPRISPSPQGPTCLHWLFHFEPDSLNKITDSFMEHGADVDAKAER